MIWIGTLYLLRTSCETLDISELITNLSLVSFYSSVARNSKKTAFAVTPSKNLRSIYNWRNLIYNQRTRCRECGKHLSKWSQVERSSREPMQSAKYEQKTWNVGIHRKEYIFHTGLYEGNKEKKNRMGFLWSPEQSPPLMLYTVF